MSPVSTQVSEQWLLERYRRHNDLAAREELMRRMAPLVRRVATAYTPAVTRTICTRSRGWA